MEIGCFSISLAVKDIGQSRAFYEKLGFEVFAGDQAHNYLIMKNGETNIGLFQGMFENNILTFNPGWDHGATELESYTDVREIHKRLQSQGVEVVGEPPAEGSGPTSFSVVDPDGNAILFDQHV